MMDAEKALAASLNGKFFGLPEVDPWAPKHQDKPKPKVRRILALPKILVGKEDKSALRRQAIMTLRDARAEPALDEVMAAVSEETMVPVAQIKGCQRYMLVVRARMIYYAAAKALTSVSTVSVARLAGDRDHSTVLSGQRRVKRRQSYYEPEYSRVLARLERKDDAG